MRSALRGAAALALGARALLAVSAAYAQPPASGYVQDPVVFPSADLKLRGVIARPVADGRFPAYVHVHGSMTVEDANGPPWTQLARNSYLERVAREGYVVMLVARRGHRGSEGTTVTYTLSQRSGSVPSAYAVYRGIETDAGDVIAALEYLRALAYVDPDRIGIGGHSVGGIVSVLAAARDPRLRAVVSLAGGFVWREGHRETSTPFVDRAWRESARKITAPVLILWAKNDTNLEPDVGRDLEKQLKAAGRTVEFILYPPDGTNGHFLFTRRDGVSVFTPDLLRFLNTNLRDRPP